ncbi:craniofacial development protein 2, partial [Biomphalaria glabrata]
RRVDLRQFSIASASDFSVLSSAKLAVFSLFRGFDFCGRLFGWIRMFSFVMMRRRSVPHSAPQQDLGTRMS